MPFILPDLNSSSKRRRMQPGEYTYPVPALSLVDSFTILTLLCKLYHTNFHESKIHHSSWNNSVDMSKNASVVQTGTGLLNVQQFWLGTSDSIVNSQLALLSIQWLYGTAVVAPLPPLLLLIRVLVLLPQCSERQKLESDRQLPQDLPTGQRRVGTLRPHSELHLASCGRGKGETVHNTKEKWKEIGRICLGHKRESHSLGLFFLPC